MHTRERDNYQLLIVFDLSTMFKFHLLCGAPGREVRFTNALVFNLPTWKKINLLFIR